MKILVVDDDRGVRVFLQYYLSELGHKVVLADRGEIALQILQQGHHFDLVITDRRMPGLLGEELIRRIKSLRNIKCIFMTADSDPDVLQVAKAAGADEVLLKPFSLEALEGALNRLERR